MNLTLVIRFCVVGLVGLAAAWIYMKARHLDVGSQFGILALGSCVIALLVAKFVLPRIGDAASTFVYSSGEAVTESETMKAASKLAQGDYEGAIAEYEKMLVEQPDNTNAIAEIAKIRVEHMNDAAGGLAYVQQQLESHDWTDENAAFLMFRIADLHVHPLNDYASAQSVLEQVITTFPSTRHSANAHHRIHEMQQAQFKAAAAHRLKTGGHA